MNKDIEKLIDKLKKKLENYELDKTFGHLSVDSIYSMFPTEIKIMLDYIEKQESNWNELKKWLEECFYDYEAVDVGDLKNKMQKLEQSKDE